MAQRNRTRLPEILTPEDLARALRQPRHSVRALIAAGDIPAVLLGGKLYTRRADLLEVLRPAAELGR